MSFADQPRPARRILAPHLWPLRPVETPAGDGPLYYLSWPGWDMFLARRLDIPASPDAAPLPLPGLNEPERDFAALDQLLSQASQLGAGFLTLDRRDPESRPALTGALRHYPPQPSATGPLLDDRSYLALWTATEYQARQSESLLAEAEASERAMWAALKGEDDQLAAPLTGPIPPAPANGRAVYAWKCWRRLAGPLLTPNDIIVPTAPEED